MKAQRIFITGASTGIGYALALEFALAAATPGMRLGLLARRRELLEQLAAECQRRGADARVFAADVRDRDAMGAAAGEFMSWTGGIDLVVANAGGGEREAQLLDPGVLVRTFELNVFGVVNTFAAFLPEMLRAGSGHLAAMASLAGYRGLPVNVSYAASKAAVISWAEGMRIRLRETGVRVTTICPGYVRTPLTANNPYMPFLMDADEAARIIRRGLERGQSQIVFPWQVALIVRASRFIPNAWYDAIAARTMRRNED